LKQILEVKEEEIKGLDEEIVQLKEYC